MVAPGTGEGGMNVAAEDSAYALLTDGATIEIRAVGHAAR